MASFGDVQAQAVLNQVWDTEVLQARYATAVIMNRILNKSSLVSDSGQVIHIPIKPRFAGGTVSPDGSFTAEAQTIVDVQVNVDTWKYVAIEIPDKTSKQAIVTLETEMPSQFGEKLSEFSEIDLANLFLLFTGATGVAGQGIGSPGSPSSFLVDSALAAVALMRKRQIPLEDMSWILPPEAFYKGWLTQERVTNANTTGLPKNVISTNFRQPILNIPAYESTLLNGATTIDDNGNLLNPASGTNQVGSIAGALIHKEALAIALQINNKYERFRVTPSGRLATGVIVNTLYGVKVTRATHGIPIYISPT